MSALEKLGYGLMLLGFSIGALFLMVFGLGTALLNVLLGVVHGHWQFEAMATNLVAGVVGFFLWLLARWFYYGKGNLRDQLAEEETDDD